MTRTGTDRRGLIETWQGDVEVITEAADPPAPTGDDVGGWSRFLIAEWDRTLCWAVVVASLAVLAVGHRRLAASPSNSEQVAFLISGGFLAILLLMTAVTLLVVSALRDTEHKVGRIAAVDGRAPTPPSSTVAWVVPAALVWVAGGAMVVAGYRRAGGTIGLSKALTGLPLAGGGLALSAISLIGYAAARRIRLARRIRTVVHGLAALDTVISDAVAVPERSLSGERRTPSERWTAAGLRRYHQPSCAALLHAGGEALAAAPGDDLAPCLLCHCEDVMQRA